MTKTYEKGIGGSDTTGLPKGKPTGIQSAVSPAASLESATDIAQTFGPDKPNPDRGSKPPTRGPNRRR